MPRVDVKHNQPMVVHQVVGMLCDQQLAWAALTMQSPGQAFANVCIDNAVSDRERRRFVDAVVATVCELGARQVLFVVSKQDRISLAHVHASCNVLSFAPVGQTFLVRADLVAQVSQVGPVVSSTWSGTLEIRVETLREEDCDREELDDDDAGEADTEDSWAVS